MEIFKYSAEIKVSICDIKQMLEMPDEEGVLPLLGISRGKEFGFLKYQDT